MKITIIGAGAVGSYLAYELIRAGQEVLLIEKGNRFQQLLHNGLVFIDNKELKSCDVEVAECMTSPSDWVIFAVPVTDIYEAYRINADYLEQGRILTVQGTFQADTLLCSHFDRALMYSSIFDHCVTMDPDGSVRVLRKGQWYLGRPYFLADPALHAFVSLLPSGLGATIVLDISKKQWSNVIWQMAQVFPALTGLDYKACYAQDICIEWLADCIVEGVRVLKAFNVDWEAFSDEVDQCLSLMQTRESGWLKHVQQVLLNVPGGSVLSRHLNTACATEIEFINGEFVHLAKHGELDVPLNTRCVAMVHEAEINKRVYTQADLAEALRYQEI